MSGMAKLRHTLRSVDGRGGRERVAAWQVLCYVSLSGKRRTRSLPGFRYHVATVFHSARIVS